MSLRQATYREPRYAVRGIRIGSFTTSSVCALERLLRIENYNLRESLCSSKRTVWLDVSMFLYRVVGLRDRLCLFLGKLHHFIG